MAYSGSMQYHAGLGNVGSYQVSGQPFVSGGLDATEATSVLFPSISRWIQVNNSGSEDLRVGFSANGVIGAGTNYLLVKPDTSVGPLELKTTAVHLSGGVDGGTSVAAGLAFINTEKIDNKALSPASPYLNWSGSAGVG